jgi:O-antigen/teichoic acid export membrane protein
MLSQFPDQIVTSLSGRVIFPALSQLSHLPRTELRAVVVRNRRPFLLLVAAPVAALVGFGDLLVHFLYDARYHEAAWMLSILAMGLWPRMLTNTLAPALLAIGQPRYFAYAAGLRLFWVCAALPAAYIALGFPGAVVAVACGSLAEYLIEGYGLWRHGLFCFRQDAATTLLWAGLLAIMLLGRWSVNLGMPFGAGP